MGDLRVSEIRDYMKRFVIPPEKGKLLKVLQLSRNLIAIRWSLKVDIDPGIVSWMEQERPEVGLSIDIDLGLLDGDHHPSGLIPKNMSTATNPPISPSVRSLHFHCWNRLGGSKNIEAIKDVIVSNTNLEKLSINFKITPDRIHFGFKGQDSLGKKENFPPFLRELHLKSFPLNSFEFAQLDGRIDWEMLRVFDFKHSSDTKPAHFSFSTRFQNISSLSVTVPWHQIQRPELPSFISSIKALKSLSIKATKFSWENIKVGRLFDPVILQHSRTLSHLDIPLLESPAWEQFNRCSIGVRTRDPRWLDVRGEGNSNIQPEKLACHVILELTCPRTLKRERARLKRMLDVFFGENCYRFMVEGGVVGCW